jgi:hypothetical protein
MRTALSRQAVLAPLSFLIILGFWGITPGCSHMAMSDEMNLRAKFVDFAKQENLKRWQIEDEMVFKERTFQDGLRTYIRDTQTQGQDAILQAPDWKQAKRDYRDKMRNTNAEVRQRIRIHRDQFDLYWLKVQRDQDQDIKDFIQPIEAEFKKNRDNPAYDKALPDFETARDDLREDYSKWKEQIKDLKTSDSFLQQ